MIKLISLFGLIVLSIASTSTARRSKNMGDPIIPDAEGKVHVPGKIREKNESLWAQAMLRQAGLDGLYRFEEVAEYQEKFRGIPEQNVEELKRKINGVKDMEFRSNQNGPTWYNHVMKIAILSEFLKSSNNEVRQSAESTVYEIEEQIMRQERAEDQMLIFEKTKKIGRQTKNKQLEKWAQRRIDRLNASKEQGFGIGGNQQISVESE